MNTAELNLSDPAIIDALRAELLIVFPDAKRYLKTQPDVRIFQAESFVTFAFEQSGWRNISWEWNSKSECPSQKYSSQPVYKPCTLGGRFSFSTLSIGD